MKKSVIIVLKADISEEGIKVDVTDLFEDITEPEIPEYTGPLNVSIQSPDWITCATDQKLESWYIYYTEK
jgi:RES domain-containing protein